MKLTISEELGLSGHTILYEIKSKTKAKWIQQAKESMDKAEKYGATTPNQMRQKERDDLREALKALGQNPSF